MKRSEINKALKELEAMCAEYKCYLPPFCGFTPEQWKHIGHEYGILPTTVSVILTRSASHLSPSGTATARWLTSTPRCTLKSCCT